MTTIISSRDESAKTSRSAKRRPKRPKASEASLESPTEDEIRILAYSLFRKRQAEGEDGDAFSDWVQAERLLAQEKTS